MNAQDTRQFLDRYLEAVSANFEAAIERYVADDELKEHGYFFQSAFPGYQIEALDTIAEGNRIAVYALFRGTHRGALMAIEATGKEVSVPFMIFYTVEGEKIVDHQIVINEMGLMQQLSVLPAPAAT